MAKRSGLGRGLGAIFKENTASIANTTAAPVVSKDKLNEKLITSENEGMNFSTLSENRMEETVIEAGHPEITAYHNQQVQESSINENKEDVSRETSVIRIALIEPNKNQPRKEFDEEKLNELADSMKRYGVLQPLLVKQNGRMYEIIAGERRWRAAKLAGLKEVPVIIRSFDPQESAEISIIENIQREDLGPVEEARAYKALIDEFGLTQEEVAGRVSKNRSTITNSLRLLQLPDRVLELLTDGKLSAGHARCLITIPDREQQELLAAEIVEKKLSVRETEKIAKTLASGKKKQKKDDTGEQELNMYLIDIARKLTASLNTKVLIKQGSKGRGKIEIDYYSDDDLEKIISRLR